MAFRRVYDEEGKGFYTIFTAEKVEKVNPVKYYKTHELVKRTVELKDLMILKFPELAASLSDKFFMKQALKTLEGFFENMERAEVNPNLLELFRTEKKKDQIKLLKGTSINPEQLTSLIFRTFKDFGYLYSRYLFQNNPRGFEGRKLPTLFELKDDDSVVKVGETDLTDGELKHIIENRKVIVSHFFDKGETWHCFFLTYRSIGGLENWREGQPHFHYISSSFGISREEFIESMKNGNYKSTSIHIELLDYGKQPKK